VDLDELANWPGADFLLHVKGQYDRNVNDDVGALSDSIDDADFDAPIYIDELFFQQAFLDDRLRFRLGFMEQQTLFDRNAYANSEDRQFTTAFLDNNAVVPLPNGLGAFALVKPLPWLEIALGAADADNVPRQAGFDTAFDGIDSVTGYLELTLRAPWWEQGLPGSYRFGGFVDGRELVHFRTGRRDRGHAGAYLSFDQRVFRERLGSLESAEGLGLFARGGYADPDVNRIAWFWSVGLQYQGLLPLRSADRLGFGVYQAIGSDVYRDTIDPDFERETGLELYYRIAAFRGIAITPDFQYVIDPGATGESDDAIVATLRLRVSF